MRKSTSLPLSLLALVAACLVPSVVHADVYKCKGADGKIAFTDRPCPTGTAGEMVMLRGERSSAPDGNSITRDCVVRARRIWALQSREVGGSLTNDESGELRNARMELDSACTLRLAASELAYRCTQKQSELTAATAAAADPAQQSRFVRVQEDYNKQCGDNAIDDDIRSHLRPSREPRREQ
jgi:hypothetical protein